MPVNKNALIRYRAIDQCLSNRHRKWTLEDLMEACSEALYEAEGIRTGVSRRTIQLDMAAMRSNKLGYSAPIVVRDRKYYTYEDPDFSIDKMPVNEQDLAQLHDALGVIRQLKGFRQLQELELVVKKIEDNAKAGSRQRAPILMMDTNERVHGLDWLDPLYQAVAGQKCLRLQYQPFQQDKPFEVIFHPYFLKSWQHRWYVIGYSEAKKRITLFPLDRIVAVEEERRTPYLKNNFFKPEIYFRDCIGVTVDLQQPVEKVIFWANKNAWQYIATKPIHASQQHLFEHEGGAVFSIEVRINLELLSALLGFGERLTVIGPGHLRQRMLDQLLNGANRYQDNPFIGEIWKKINQNNGA